MNGASAAWGGGPPAGGGRDRRTADLPRLKWRGRLRPDDTGALSHGAAAAGPSFQGGGNGAVRLRLGSCKAGVAGGVESGDQTLTTVTSPPRITLARTSVFRPFKFQPSLPILKSLYA